MGQLAYTPLVDGGELASGITPSGHAHTLVHVGPDVPVVAGNVYLDGDHGQKPVAEHVSDKCFHTFAETMFGVIPPVAVEALWTTVCAARAAAS